jgi:hypothetical protein
VPDSKAVEWFWGLTCDFWAKNAEKSFLEQTKLCRRGNGKRRRLRRWQFFHRTGAGLKLGVEGAVAVQDLFAWDGRSAFAGDNDAGQVHGVGGRDRKDGGAFAGPGGAERFHSFGEGVLFANEAGDEAASADLAASFEAAEDVEEVAPFGGVGFAGEQVAEEDAVAGEELAGEGFEGGVGAAGFFDGLLGELRLASLG